MLSPEQVKARAGRFGASDVGVLMRGETGPILELWKEKTGHPEHVPLDLSGVWAVQLGNATEQLNLTWAERKYGPVLRRGQNVIAFDPEWAACTLDGWLEDHKVPIECKHVGGREPYEVVVERYQPQLQWIMFVTDAREIAFSVIIGANEPVIEFIPADPEYIGELVLRATQFWRHVQDKTPPVDVPTVPPPALIKKTYDMSSHPAWPASAASWLQSYGAVEIAKHHEKILKALMPDDAKVCHGCGVRITRDRAGRLSLREDR